MKKKTISISSRKQPCIPSDFYNFQFHINTEMSNHAFKQTRDYNGEIKKDIQVDLDTFTHISAYSGILRHVQILLSIFYSQLAIETESKILTAVSKGQRNNKLLLPIAFLLRSSALVFCLQICNPPRSILDLPFTPTFSQPFLWLLNHVLFGCVR